MTQQPQRQSDRPPKAISPLAFQAGAVLAFCLALGLGIAWLASMIPQRSEPQSALPAKAAQRAAQAQADAVPHAALVPWFRDAHQPQELLVQPGLESARSAAHRPVSVAMAAQPWHNNPVHRPLPLPLPLAKADLPWPRMLEQAAAVNISFAVQPWPRTALQPEPLPAAAAGRMLASTPWLRDAAAPVAANVATASTPPWTYRLLAPAPAAVASSATPWAGAIEQPASANVPAASIGWMRGLERPAPAIVPPATMPADGPEWHEK